MSEELYAELESQTVRQLKAVQAMMGQDGVPDDPFFQKLTEPQFQEWLAAGLAKTDILLKVAHERGILDPWDMRLLKSVMKARFDGEGEDNFAAALEAMARLGQPVESE